MSENVIPMVRPQAVSEIENLRIQNKVMSLYLDHIDPHWRETVSDTLGRALERVEARP